MSEIMSDRDKISYWEQKFSECETERDKYKRYYDEISGNAVSLEGKLISAFNEIDGLKAALKISHDEYAQLDIERKRLKAELDEMRQAYDNEDSLCSTIAKESVGWKKRAEKLAQALRTAGAVSDEQQTMFDEALADFEKGV